MRRRGPVRIGVRPEDAPARWTTHKRSGGIERRLAKGLEAGQGMPSQWHVSYTEVPREKWVSLEMHDYRSGRWEPLTVGRLKQLEVLKQLQEGDQ